jgi:hypothetical protein
MSLSNSYVFKQGASGSEVLVNGQLDGTFTEIGSLVDVTNKADGGAVKFHPDFIAGYGVSFAVTFTSTDNTQLNAIKLASRTGAQLPGVIESGVGTEAWQCDTWVFTGRSDAAPVNGVTQVSITISSSGVCTPTAPS